MPTLPEAPSSILGGAFASAASFFTDPPFSGEVNLLTTSAHRARRSSFRATCCRAASPMSRSARRPPAGIGRARVDEPVRSLVVDRGRLVLVARSPRATTTASACRTARSSIRRGPCVRSRSRRHRRQPQRRRDLRERSLDAVADRRVEYGGRYAHYDYLRSARCSARASACRSTPFDENTHVTASVAQRMLAPGAEEFLRADDRRTLAAARAHVRAPRPARTCASSARASSTSASTTTSTAPTCSACAASISASTIS